MTNAQFATIVSVTEIELWLPAMYFIIILNSFPKSYRMYAINCTYFDSDRSNSICSSISFRNKSVCVNCGKNLISDKFRYVLRPHAVVNLRFCFGGEICIYPKITNSGGLCLLTSGVLRNSQRRRLIVLH